MNLNVPRHLINQHVKHFSPELQSGNNTRMQLLSDLITASAFVCSNLFRCFQNSAMNV